MISELSKNYRIIGNFWTIIIVNDNSQNGVIIGIIDNDNIDNAIPNGGPLA